MKILVTGGTGFIGSHTSVLLLQSGHDVVIADNLVNSKPTVIDSIEKITNRRPKFYECDLTDEAICEQIFSENDFDSVIHFAGLKAVGESVSIPLEYYKNNLLSTLNVLMSMRRHGCKSFIFSSSATVYGNPHALPITEDFPLSYTNPYGGTKYTITQKGLEAESAAASSIAYSVRMKVNKNVVPYVEQLKRDALVKAEHKVRNDGTCTVSLSLSDNSGSILNLDMLTPDEESARKIERNFKLNAERLYHSVYDTIYTNGDSK